MARDIFKRLSAGRSPPTEEAITQSRRREDPKIFLKDILSNGPAPATLVIARGAERGFTKRQITYAREVPMVKGRLDRKASTATGYAWLVWERDVCTGSRLVWVPPCRKALERDADY